MLYQDINTIITTIDPDLSAAEAHGLATAMLCVNETTKPSFWLQELFQQDQSALNLEDKFILEDLFKEIRQDLASDEYVFELLLPNDESLLSEQLDALRQWCQGFLFGLGTAAATVSWPEESREIVKDIAEFTKLDPDAAGEEAENDFMEITEYLRAAVIFLRTGLSSGDKNTLH